MMNPHMKFQDSSFNGLKVTVGTKSVTHAPTHPLTHAPKVICPINFFKVGGITSEDGAQTWEQKHPELGLSARMEPKWRAEAP